MDAAASGKAQPDLPARPRDADIGKAAFLLEPDGAVLVDRALAREDPLLPSGHEDIVELQPLRGVKRHQRDLAAVRIGVAVHDKRDMFEEPLERIEILHRVDKFGQVLEPPFGFRRTVRLPHRRVAGLIQNRLCQVGVMHGGGRVAPARDIAAEPVERGARRRTQLVRLHEVDGGGHQRLSGCPRLDMDGLKAGRAEPAFRQVDDALEGQIVGRLRDQAKIGDGVPDLGPLVESCSHDAVGKPDGDEAFLELAGLEPGPHQHRDLRQVDTLDLQGLDLGRNGARLVGAVPVAVDAELLAVAGTCVKGLAEAAFIARDQPRRRREDMAGRTVILLQPDDGGARKVALEFQDVADLGAAPAIDRLVVVADAAQVALRAGQQPKPQILRHIGVLILVDHDVRDAIVIFGQHVGMRLQHRQHVKKQVAEIDGVQRQQPRLVGFIELPQPPVGKIAGLGHADLVGRQAAVLPALDHAAEKAHRPAFGIDVVGFHQLLENAVLVVDIENREIASQPDKLGMAPQHPRRQRVERPEPHLLGKRPDHRRDPHLHLARRLVGEGHGKDVPRLRRAGGDKLGEPRCQDPRLAGAGAGKHQDRPGKAAHGFTLRGVQTVAPGMRCLCRCLHGAQPRKSLPGVNDTAPACGDSCHAGATPRPVFFCPRLR